MSFIPVIHAVLLVSSVCPAEPILLTDSVSDYVISFFVQENGDILFVNDSDELTLVNVDHPMETSEFPLDFDLEEFGWESPVHIGNLCRSRDGKLICFARTVSVPSENQPDERFIPGPSVVVVCGSDGSDPRILGLTMEVGGGPHFEFTSDSESIYGAPLLGCHPTVDEYVAYWSREDDSNLIEGFIIDVSSGERSGSGQDVLSDGFYCNPWSDLVAGGGFPSCAIFDIGKCEELSRIDCNEGDIIDRWVLPDAGLAYMEGFQVLRYSDGSTVENLNDEITVFGKLHDGRHVFQSGGYGSEVLLGQINWEDFSITDCDTLLAQPNSFSYSSIVKETHDRQGLVIHSSGSLYLYPLP